MNILIEIIVVVFSVLKITIAAIFHTISFCSNSLKQIFERWKMSFKSMRAKGMLSSLNKQKRIFVYGAQHAGKTTLIASLFEHLSGSKTYLARRDASQNPEGVKLIRKFRKRIREGKFPDSTQDGYFGDINFDLFNRGSNTSRRYVIQEIAGETAVKFDPTHEEHRSISVGLKDSLMNSSGILIVASSDPENITEQLDEIESVYDFLELLERYKYNRPILLILTKYDLVQNHYINCVQAAQDLYADAVSLLSEMPKTSIQEFSVGSVTSETDHDGSEVKKIEGTSYGAHIDNLLRWMEGL